MPRQVKSSDVLKANALTKVPLAAKVIGRYRPTGPNKWDDWKLENEKNGVVVEVPAGNKLQLEPLGADPEIRFRWREGRSSVLLLRWIPTAEDSENLSSGKWGVQEANQATLIEKILGIGPRDDPRDDMLEYVLEVLTEPYTADRGIGWEAMLIKTLRGK